MSQFQRGWTGSSAAVKNLICCHTQANAIYLRKGALERLLLARDTILSVNKSFSLKLVYGYRHPEVQEAYFTEICRRLTAKEKNLSKEILFEKAHMFVAVPEVAGHPTGGAVDLTVLRDGEKIDMGSKIADFSSPELLPTFSQKISDTQRENRLILRNAMMAAGFAPFDGEWWHFSYGDREWAAYYKKLYALYEGISFEI